MRSHRRRRTAQFTRGCPASGVGAVSGWIDSPTLVGTTTRGAVSDAASRGLRRSARTAQGVGAGDRRPPPPSGEGSTGHQHHHVASTTSARTSVVIGPSW